MLKINRMRRSKKNSLKKLLRFVKKYVVRERRENVKDHSKDKSEGKEKKAYVIYKQHFACVLG